MSGDYVLTALGPLTRAQRKLLRRARHELQTIDGCMKRLAGLAEKGLTPREQELFERANATLGTLGAMVEARNVAGAGGK